MNQCDNKSGDTQDINHIKFTVIQIYVSNNWIGIETERVNDCIHLYVVLICVFHLNLLLLCTKFLFIYFLFGKLLEKRLIHHAFSLACSLSYSIFFFPFSFIFCFSACVYMNRVCETHNARGNDWNRKIHFHQFGAPFHFSLFVFFFLFIFMDGKNAQLTSMRV